MDPMFEIERLKGTLRMRGFSNDDIENIARRATNEISEAVTEAIAWALDRATEAGVEADADKFVSELRAVYTGSSFSIMTDSGMTDFSEPPFPMMSRLLKNPKVAKDGTLYKVIPMGGKSMPTDLMSAQRNIAAARVQVTSNHTNPMNAGMQFSGAFAAQQAAERNSRITANKIQRGSKDGVKFRTVTSKQDPAKNWVRPGKDKDMTVTLHEINNDLKEVIESSVMGIIQSYEVEVQ
jgi:hypothetical protein